MVRRARRPLVICLGDLALDVVVRGAAVAAPGSDVPGSVRFRLGGSAAATARWVARLGGRAAFCGAVGRDGIGRRLVAALRGDRVAVHAPRRDGHTATICVLVEAGGERSFVSDRGAADALAPTDLRAPWFRGAAWLHLPAYSLLADPLRSATMRAVDLARQAGAGISVDLASARPLAALGATEAERRVTAVAPDVLFATPAEARVLDAGLGEHKLLRLAPVVVLKEGRAGCRVFARREEAADGLPPLTFSVATKPLQVSDSTGAGDAFDAGFIVAWLAAGGPAPGADHAPATLRRAAVAGNRAATRHLSGSPATLDL
jgi:sugar/nucleoside kinase (ribokinase family)